MEQTTDPDVRRGNTEDAEYDAYLARVQSRFVDMASGPLFTIDAADLWTAYVDAMPPALRQYHTCTACRHFIEHYGALVVIGEDGAARSAVWNPDDTPAEYAASVAAMLRVIRRAKVTGVFRSSDATWGKPVTGIWRHFAVTPPKGAHCRHPRGGLLTAGQRMAEQREDYNTVSRALAEWTEPTLAQALTLLRADTLFRSEKVLGQAEWLYALHTSAKTNHAEQRKNLIWRAIATAPAGFCHPRASMIGTLLDDIASGADFGEVSRRFREKMHPLQYQRPTAAPSAGTIARAEKMVETLGIARSLERRFARLDEIETLWTPAPVVTKTPAGGVFGHLAPKGEAATTELNAPAVTMTWEKFRRAVLPNATVIEVNAPAHGNYMGLVTAEHADAPPILQWDREERRNPVSWYVYHGGTGAERWGLSSGWVALSAIAGSPHEWYGGTYPHMARGVVFLIPGAVDSRESGNALFPETMRSELHGVRSVIEAYSRKASIGGRDTASACGLAFSENNAVTLRVTSAIGPRLTYTIDRLD